METLKVGSAKGFLIVTSFLEGATGLALMTIPSFVINLLLGSLLTDPISIVIARLAGSALTTLAIACWFSQKSENASGLLIALAFYNLASVVLLALAGLQENLTGPVLWPIVVIHITMGLWSTKCLSSTRNPG